MVLFYLEIALLITTPNSLVILLCGHLTIRKQALMLFWEDFL